MNSKQELEVLLSEEIEDAKARQTSVFNSLGQGNSQSIVLFGAGGLGRRTLQNLRSVGIDPVAIADNNATSWGSDVDGMKVMSPDEAAARFGNNSTFVVTIWGAASRHRYEETRNQLETLGCLFVSPYAWLAWRFAGEMLPYYSIDLPSNLLRDKPKIFKAFNLLSDDFSAQEYVSQIKWRLTGDPSDLSSPVAASQYLVSEVNLSDKDYVLDCGAYDGDTLKSWIAEIGDFARYVALEPDNASRTRLETEVTTYSSDLASRISSLPYAVASENGTATFLADGTAASSFLRKGQENSVVVECRKIDDLIVELGFGAPTFLKMDIEGAELDALAGATFLMRISRPKMALCVYHRQSDLWRIPNFVNEVCDESDFYLRPHNEQGWDLVCYVVPKGKLDG